MCPKTVTIESIIIVWNENGDKGFPLFNEMVEAAVVAASPVGIGVSGTASAPVAAAVGFPFEMS